MKAALTGIETMVGLLAFGGLLLFLDQWTKCLAEVYATEHQIRCGPLLRIHCVMNTRKLDGAGRTRTMLLVTWVVAFVCGVVLYNSGAWFHTRGALFGLGLALGGAAGNLLDLFRRRSIVDFIELGWWPVFNLADVGIVAGLVLAFWPRR